MRTFVRCAAMLGILPGCQLQDGNPITPPDLPTAPAAVPPHSFDVPAFPGAEGWGATALNNSRRLPLQVHFVSSRRSDGPGTLAAALSNTSSEKYDIIVFRVGGLFEPPQVEITSRHIYLAGQTAPGSGVSIDGGGEGENLSIRTIASQPDLVSDIVIRYLRIMHPRTGVAIHAGDRIILDHVSVGWSRRYPVLVSRRDRPQSAPISGVVIQNSLFHNALAEHPTSVSMSWARGAPPSPIGMSDISVHRNLFANNDRRNPRTGADNSLVANNVIYNWNISAADATVRGKHDFIANFAKHGPFSRSNYVYAVNPRCDQDGAEFSIYAAANSGPAGSDPQGDNWYGDTRQVGCYHSSGDVPGAAVPSSFRRVPHEPQAWNAAPFPVTLRSAPEAYGSVLATAGASARLACDGTWLNARDPVDTWVVEQVRSGSGPGEAPAAAASLPEYETGTPCQDTDADGIPDEWEVLHCGSATGCRANAMTAAGYLMIEHYLNGTRP